MLYGGAIETMKADVGSSLGEGMQILNIKVDPAKATGVVLTAGIVAWVLRTGALMTSLLSTIPLWKGYDPLPILISRDDEDEDIDEKDKVDAMFDDEANR